MVIYYFFIWFLIILSSYFIILFGYLHFSNKSDILNNVLGFGALLFIFINIPIFLLLMFQNYDLHKVTLPLFTLSVLLPLFLIGIIILISTGLLHLYRIFFKYRDSSNLEKKKEKPLKETSKARKDTYRKINHVFIFIGLLVVWYLSYDIIKSTTKKKVKMEPQTNNMLYLYLRLLTKPKSIENVLFSLEWFYYVLFFFFYIFCLIMMANELTRKTRHMAFPLNFIPKFLLTDEEQKTYGTYLYFAIGQMFAAFVCPPMAYFSILAMSSIGDLMTSQIGIRYGKRHILWNKEKTYEGTLAGTIISFIICLFFVGFFWALIFSLAFTAFDLFTRKPINISDNLLIPIGCALIYIFIRYTFDFNYYTIILDFF